MNSTIDDIKATISRRGGLAVGNRYQVIVLPPPEAFGATMDIRDLSILCESASLPGRQIETGDHSYYRQSVKYANGYVNEDVDIEFNLTSDFFIKDIFYKWTNLIINRDTYKLNYASTYKRDIVISQQDLQNKTVYAVKLKNAFPITVAAIAVGNSSADVQKLTVSFTYEDFEELLVPQPEKPISPLGITDLPGLNPNFA